MNTSLAKDIVTTEVSKTIFVFLVVSLFFFIGFSNNLNAILISHLKNTFTLTTHQSTLVDLVVVYIAYFLIALPAYVMKQFSYMVGIITGLMFFSIGVFLFISAVYPAVKLFCRRSILRMEILCMESGRKNCIS